MSIEPTTSVVGVGIVTAATLFFGPILGEYAVIFLFGLAGTFIALSQQHEMTAGQLFWFMFRGVALSITFTGFLTEILVHNLPTGWGMTPHTAMGMVSLAIGWTSDRWDYFKNVFISWGTKKLGFDSSDKTNTK